MVRGVINLVLFVPAFASVSVAISAGVKSIKSRSSVYTILPVKMLAIIISPLVGELLIPLSAHGRLIIDGKISALLLLIFTYIKIRHSKLMMGQQEHGILKTRI